MSIPPQTFDDLNAESVRDGNRIAVLQVAVTALAELIRHEYPDTHSRLLNCLQQTRDLPENMPYSSAFDELLAMLDGVQR